MVCMTRTSIQSNIHIIFEEFVIILTNPDRKLALTSLHLPSKAFMCTCSICTLSLMLINSSIGISSGKPDSTPLKPESNWQFELNELHMTE